MRTPWPVALAAGGLLAGACGPDPAKIIDIVCWAEAVASVSSEHEDYPADNALQAPDVTNAEGELIWDDPGTECYSSTNAWSPEEEDAGDEHIVLTYPGAISVNEVHVYENYGPGTVRMVELTHSQDESLELPFAVDADDQGVGQPCEAPLEVDIRMSDGFQYTREPFDTVRLDLDTSLVSGWNEIDAVGLVGRVMDDFSNAPDGCERWDDPDDGDET